MTTKAALAIAVLGFCLTGEFVLAQESRSEANIPEMFKSALGMQKACETALAISQPRQPSSGASSDEIAATMYCFGFIDGLQNGAAFMSIATKNDSVLCIPQKATPEQLIRVFLKYCNANPEKLHLAPGPVLVGAFLEAFPCKGAQ